VLDHLSGAEVAGVYLPRTPEGGHVGVVTDQKVFLMAGNQQFSQKKLNLKIPIFYFFFFPFRF
jgi:hypothetical protein